MMVVCRSLSDRPSVVRLEKPAARHVAEERRIGGERDGIRPGRDDVIGRIVAEDVERWREHGRAGRDRRMG
jgi:hypothetical protein